MRRHWRRSVLLPPRPGYVADRGTGCPPPRLLAKVCERGPTADSHRIRSPAGQQGVPSSILLLDRALIVFLGLSQQLAHLSEIGVTDRCLGEKRLHHSGRASAEDLV